MEKLFSFVILLSGLQLEMLPLRVLPQIICSNEVKIPLQYLIKSGIEVMSDNILQRSVIIKGTDTISGTFDVMNYKPGIYYLMVVGKDFVATKKIVKVQ